MNDNINFDQEQDDRNRDSGDRHAGDRLSLPGVVALAVVTAGVLGSVFFSFHDQEKVTFSVSQLMEEAQSAEDQFAPDSAELSASLSDSSGETVKGVLDVSDVAQAMMPCVVSITSESVQVVEYYFYGKREIPSESAGSGIIIGQNDTELLIATNYHVVEDADSITVCFSVETDDTEETIAEAKLKGSDQALDLAVVAVKLEDISRQTASQIRISVLGDSDNLVVGERAIAIGNALGYGQTVTAGIVSAVNRELTDDQGTQTYIQTDAAINFGNSGGALLNSAGQVIGINTAKAVYEGVERMGYAIPINAAKPILEELMKKETRDKVDEAEKGSLGIVPKNVSSEAQMIYNIPAGAFVYQVAPGSAAEEAGIVPGDIITRMDGNTITNSESLERLMNYYKAGETVEIVYETGQGGVYTEKKVSVTLQEAQAQGSGTANRYGW